MFERREDAEKRFYEIVERFRQKGALSRDKAMSAEELGLPPRFEAAMKRRLDRLGVFVEVDGKYYLSEERLKQIEAFRSVGEMGWGPRRKIVTLRIVQIVAAVFFMALLLVSILVQSWELRFVSIIFLVVWLVISVLQIYYLSKLRKGISSRNSPQLIVPVT
jgi:hypothetical protein